MERDFLRWLNQQAYVLSPNDPSVLIGIGDDATVLQGDPQQAWVVTTDMLMDGVDFLLDQHDPESVGRKSLAVNLSDLAAMGAIARFALVSVALPRSLSPEFAQRLTTGLNQMAAEYDVALVGGDTNVWAQGFVISVTAIGQVEPAKAWTRSGAQPGDRLLVTGCCGGSLLGRHLTCTPRLREAQWLQEQGGVHAAIDISDGLAWDAFQLARASQCGLQLGPGPWPIHRDAEARSRLTGRAPLEHMLYDGEDFELLLAVSPETARRLVKTWPFDTPLMEIGEFTSEAGLWTKAADGVLAPLAPKGWEHGGTSGSTD